MVQSGLLCALVWLIVQGVDRLVPHGVDLIDVFQFDQMCHEAQPPEAITAVEPAEPSADWMGTSTVSPSSRPERIST